MPGVTYGVDVVYRTHGSLALPELEKPNRLLGEMNQTADDLGKKLMGSVGGALDAVASAAMYAGAAISTAMGFALGATISFQSQLESTELALAGIFQSANLSQNLNNGLEMSAELIRGMRKDAALLPGEFKDLVNTFQMIAIPSFRGGMSANETRKLAAKTMAFAEVALGGNQEMAAREMANLLEGRATVHNKLGLKLGFVGADARKLNAMGSNAERATEINKRFEPYQESFNAFGDTFKGLSSTLMDNVREFAGVLTGPLFEKIKGAFADVNKWYFDNKDEILFWADRFGQKMGKAFDWVEGKIKSWGPQMMKLIEMLDRFLGNDPLTTVGGIVAGLGALKLGTMGYGAVAGGGAAAGEVGAIGVAAGLALPELVAFSAAVAALAWGVSGAVEQVNDANSEGSASWIHTKKSVDEMGVALDSLSTKINGHPFKQMLGDALLSVLDEFADAARKDAEDLDAFVGALQGLDAWLGKWVNKGLKAAGIDEEYVGNLPGLKKDDSMKWKGQKKTLESDALNKHPDIIANPPNHHTTIHKVEILVSSNQDASRVARLTKDALAELSRNPKSSRRGPAFTPHQ